MSALDQKYWREAEKIYGLQRFPGDPYFYSLSEDEQYYYFLEAKATCDYSDWEEE